jgi:hypothetical protein
MSSNNLKITEVRNKLKIVRQNGNGVSNSETIVKFYVKIGH